MNRVILIDNLSGETGRKIAKSLAAELGLPYFEAGELRAKVSQDPASKGHTSRQNIDGKNKRLSAFAAKNAPCVIVGKHIAQACRSYSNKIRISICPGALNEQICSGNKKNPPGTLRYDYSQRACRTGSSDTKGEGFLLLS